MIRWEIHMGTMNDLRGQVFLKVFNRHSTHAAAALSKNAVNPSPLFKKGAPTSFVALFLSVTIANILLGVDQTRLFRIATESFA